ncbi:5'-methylthioadenosine/S-adenosylhomocysteine nucleosidase [Candidatus Hepatincolaceae symbiont of Richtersius coronifer]
MKIKIIGLVVAMPTEFISIKHALGEGQVIEKEILQTLKFNYKGLEIISMLSNIGKAASASTTTLLFSQYKCDIIINVGSCGGLNKAIKGSIIVSNKAAYCDVDVTAFNYKLGQMAEQPEAFISSNNFIDYNNLCTFIENKYSILKGQVITADSFIADPKIINKIKNMYFNTLAIEMEAAAIAQICYLYNKDFILIKKVSDLADQDAATHYTEEIKHFPQGVSDILLQAINYCVQLT